MNSAPVTIGISIPIPNPYYDQLAAVRAELGDPAAAKVSPHITLLMPTEVTAAQLTQIDEHLKQLALGRTPFTVLLQGTGTFRPISPVVFVQVVAGATECEDLANLVRSGPLAQDLRFPYHPHVTVAQDLSDPVLDDATARLAGFEATFVVNGFQRYIQTATGVWKPTHTFDFSPPTNPTH